VRTEQLLRQTLDDLADQARPPEVALARITAHLPRRSGRRRRRTLVLVIAAVVVLALAVAVPTFLANRTAEPVGRVKGNWNLNHRVEPPPGWEVRTQVITPDSEGTTLGAASRAATEEVSSCMVDVFGPDRGDPTARRADRTPVTVDGRPAFWSGQSDLEATQGVSWEYQPGAFALVSCGTGRASDDIAIAERVRFQPVPVRLPFRVRSLPTGYEPVFVAPPLASSEGTFLGGAQFRAENREVRSFSVAVTPGRTDIPPGLPGWETDSVGGRRAVLSARDAKLCLNLEQHTACIQTAEGEAEDLTRSLWAAGRRELLVEVAKRLVIAEDLDDPGTWFPANRAVPR
jgi:hypothetical protein